MSVMEKTKHPIRLRRGGEIPVGSEVLWDKGIALIGGHRVSALGAARAMGIRQPSDSQLERWVYDSVCESILGHEVEPDGFDYEGSPSWLLAMGLI